MKTAAISVALAVLVGLVHAAPAPVPNYQPDYVQITFQGAPADVAFFTQNVPVDGSTFQICTSFLSFIRQLQSALPYTLLYFLPLSRVTAKPGWVMAMLICVLDNPLSISHILVSGNAHCEFFGIDGSDTVVGPFQTVDVGPPQTLASGFCKRYWFEKVFGQAVRLRERWRLEEFGLGAGGRY